MRKLPFEVVFPLCILGYVVIGLLVYGWHYNRPPPCDLRDEKWCRMENGMGSVTRGFGWPVYLAAQAAIWVTKPAEKAR